MTVPVETDQPVGRGASSAIPPEHFGADTPGSLPLAARSCWRRFAAGPITFLRSNWPWLFLAAFLYVVFYSSISELGYYSDDYLYPWYGSGPAPRLWGQFKSHGLDRPLLHYGIAVLGRFALLFGQYQVQVLYTVSFLLFAVNCGLVFSLCRRLTDHTAGALAAALLFAVYPPDGVRILLIDLAHFAGTALFLTSVILYHRWRHKLLGVSVLGVVAIALGLFYELYLLVTLLIPWVIRDFNRWRTWIHSVLDMVVLGVFIAVFLGLKNSFSPGRINQLPDQGLGDLLGMSVDAMRIGSTTALTAFAERLGTVWRARDPDLGLFALFLTPLVWWGLWRTCQDTGKQGPSFTRTARLLVVCAVGLPLHYAPYITANRIDTLNVLYGRRSDTHEGAEVFVVLAAAVIIGQVLRLTSQRRKVQAVIITPVVLAICCYAAFHRLAVRQMALSWDAQRRIWADVCTQGRDITRKSLVVVDDLWSANSVTQYVETVDWTCSFMLGQLLGDRSRWPVVVAGQFAEKNLLFQSGMLTFRKDAWVPYTNQWEYAPENVVRYRCVACPPGVKRIYSPLRVGNVQIPLKSDADVVFGWFRPGPIYTAMFPETVQPQWRKDHDLSGEDRSVGGVIIRSTAPLPAGWKASGGGFIEVPGPITRALIGQRIRAWVELKATPDRPSAEFAIAYSTWGSPNSGWHRFPVTADFRPYEFTYEIPRTAPKAPSMIGIWSDTAGQGGGTVVASVWIELLRDTERAERPPASP